MGHRHRGGVFFAMRLAVLVVPVQMGAISTGRLGVVGGLELPSERRLGELPEGAPGVLGAEFLDVDVYELVRRTEHLASEFLGDWPCGGRCVWCRVSVLVSVLMSMAVIPQGSSRRRRVS